MGTIRFLLAALLTAQLALATTACAQGPVREWLKERRAAREANAEEPASKPETSSGPVTSPGSHVQSVTVDGMERKFIVHVPKSYDGSKAVPLMLSFHGGGGNMEYQADDTRYGQISASEKEGFIVVFPNGYSRLPGGKLATWNAGGCCGPAKEKNIDDVAFARAVVASVEKQLNIDRQKVFANGFSNGAMLTHRLACEASDVFKGIAPVAGTDNTPGCNLANPVSVMIIHARNDTNNKYDGGVGEKSVDRRNMANSTSVPETLSRWVSRNGCAKEPRRVIDKPGVYCDRYQPCRGNVSVAICVTETGQHSWPGAQRSRSTEGASQAIDANDVMWNFFLGRNLQ